MPDPTWVPPAGDAAPAKPSRLKDWDEVIVFALLGEPLVGGAIAERFRKEAGKHHPANERRVMELGMVARSKCTPGTVDFGPCLARIVIRNRSWRWIVYGQVADDIVTLWLISSADGKLMRTVKLSAIRIDDDAIHRAWITLFAE